MAQQQHCRVPRDGRTVSSKPMTGDGTVYCVNYRKYSQVKCEQWGHGKGTECEQGGVETAHSVSNGWCGKGTECGQ